MKHILLFLCAILWGGLAIAGLVDIGRGEARGWLLLLAALLTTVPLLYAWRRLARFVRGGRERE